MKSGSIGIKNLGKSRLFLGIPRVSGGDPTRVRDKQVLIQYSPRERGWSLWKLQSLIFLQVFPAWAGVIPILTKFVSCIQSIPRVSGGDPVVKISKSSIKKCLSPAKKYKLYKSSINKSLHFAQRSLSSSTRGQRVIVQLNLSREWKNRMTTVVISAILNPVSRVSTPH